nr:hypothetical protein CFP56_63739 [Quercus suber]
MTIFHGCCISPPLLDTGWCFCAVAKCGEWRRWHVFCLCDTNASVLSFIFREGRDVLAAASTGARSLPFLSGHRRFMGTRTDVFVVLMERDVDDGVKKKSASDLNCLYSVDILDCQ